MPEAIAADHRVVVVGGGQAGLAISYYLTRAGVQHLVLDADDQVGASWTNRWDSLRLFTPAAYSALPGLPFPGPGDRYPGGRDVARYLIDYAERFGLPLRTASPVRSLVKDDTFTLDTPTGPITAARVVVATGAFGTPATPAFAHHLEPDLPASHSHDYRRPDDVPQGVVLVVGAGNTGYQLELARAGRTVHLAHGATARTVPQRIAGRDIFWWLTRTRLVSAPPDTRIGRRLRANDPIIGTSRAALHAAGVQFRPRALAGACRTISFADGTTLQPDAILWATGYRHDDRWIHIPGALDEHGALQTTGLNTPTRGLHVLGRPWQRSRGSALLGFVGQDAHRLATRITTQEQLSDRGGRRSQPR
ncbi:flavin-containing monooxygenase [Promicromonospora sp. NPDC050880]|uniref:flavin-containing monooxygenase n=1 Tax=Promicromonospora sp. NPDC050880 TaxID=3364406 RepID=UPI0037AE9592